MSFQSSLLSFCCQFFFIFRIDWSQKIFKTLTEMDCENQKFYSLNTSRSSSVPHSSETSPSLSSSSSHSLNRFGRIWSVSRRVVISWKFWVLVILVLILLAIVVLIIISSNTCDETGTTIPSFPIITTTVRPSITTTTKIPSVTTTEVPPV